MYLVWNRIHADTRHATSSIPDNYQVEQYSPNTPRRALYNRICAKLKALSAGGRALGLGREYGAGE